MLGKGDGCSVTACELGPGATKLELVLFVVMFSVSASAEGTGDGAKRSDGLGAVAFDVRVLFAEFVELDAFSTRGIMLEDGLGNA